MGDSLENFPAPEIGQHCGGEIARTHRHRASENEQVVAAEELFHGRAGTGNLVIQHADVSGRMAVMSESCGQRVGVGLADLMRCGNFTAPDSRLNISSIGTMQSAPSGHGAPVITSQQPAIS